MRTARNLALPLMICLILAGCTRGGSTIRPIEDSVLPATSSAEVTPEPTLTDQGCFAEPVPGAFVWDAGDPGYNPGIPWVLDPSPESNAENQTQYHVWHLDENSGPYGGDFVVLPYDGGPCQTLPLAFDFGESAGGPTIDATASVELGTGTVLHVMIFRSNPGPTSSGSFTSDPATV